MRIWRWISGLLAVAALGGGLCWYWIRSNDKPINFRTEHVEISDVARTINATGTVEPEELINVGAQVGGQIIQFGRDCDGKTVDYGSRVKAGAVLAQIDDAVYQAEYNQAQATVKQAEAQISQADAEVKQAQVKADLARREFARAARLFPTKVIALNEYENTKATYDNATISVEAAEAALQLARSNLAQATATRDKARHNVEYCTIRSSVDGVIIDRRVNVGQTVVSSMTAPSLFLLAKDLRKMRIWVSVNEADIGGIQPKLPVIFTIDAYPGEEFSGEVLKTRLNATLTQNVVTYTVEIMTDNSNGRLLPYMTANVKFILQQRKQIPTVSNAALRWQPPAELVAPQYHNLLSLKPTIPAAGQKAYVWLLRPEGLEPQQLQLGISDGVRTEIINAALSDQAEIVNGILPASAGKSRISPFLPQARKRL